MILYLVNIINEFLPAALVTGAVLALWKSDDENAMVKHASLGAFAGLFIGGILYALTLSRLSTADVRTYLGAINISFAVLTITGIYLSFRKKGIVQTLGWAGSILFIAALTAKATFSFILFVSDRTLSVTSVLNTEVILNISGILSGVCIIIFLVLMTVHLSFTAGRGISLGLLTIISALLALSFSAEVILGLMRAEIIELTSGRLTFVAKVTNYSYLLTYLLVALLGVLYLILFFKRHGPDLNNSTMNRAEERKTRSRELYERRWLKAVVITIVVLASILLYYDLYASRPPKISTPIRLMPDADGLISVRIDDVKDGKLHRFSYVTDDGYVIRFFLINLYKDRTKIGVVFDACVMCGGEKGYIQKGNEVICLACNVRIFVPSIGKSGGCNPIPLKHRVEDENIIISVVDLETEKDYFPELIPVEARNSLEKEPGRPAAIYTGFMTAVNDLLSLGIQDSEPGKCHLNNLAMKGRNT